MAAVPATDLWVDANFKRNPLANMRIGQPVTVITDIYGDDVKYTGSRRSGYGNRQRLSAARANATGNWIKVVQRLPVRYRTGPPVVNNIRRALAFIDAGHRGYR